MEKDQDKYVNHWFDGYLGDKSSYTTEEKDLIKVIKDLDIEPALKMRFICLLMNYETEKNRVRNLQDRLTLSYAAKGITDYLGKIISFNPKLGEVNIQAGESGGDEKDNGNLDISIRVKYNENVEEYFAAADAIISNAKRVLNIILVDAKKMRLI